MVLKCYTQFVITFGKCSSGHRTRKGHFSFQFQRQGQRMLKILHNCIHFTCQQSNAQNSSIQASIVCELKIPDVQAGFRKNKRNQRTNCQHLLDHIESKRIPEKNFCFIYYSKAFYCVDHNIVWKILQAIRISDHLTCLL